MKKYISILLVMVLCLGMTAAPAFASQQSFYANQTKTIGMYGYIDQTGGLWLWGPNGSGEAGQEYKQNVNNWIEKPVKVMDHVVAFDRGTMATIVLKDDGSVWTFGMDCAAEKMMVNEAHTSGKIAAHYEPVKVLDGCIAVGVALGYPAFGALKANGDLYTWGSNTFNGNGHAAYDPNIPLENYEYWWHGEKTGGLIRPTLLAKNVKSFAMGKYGTYITNSGDVYYWGFESWFYTGKDGSIQPPQKVFTKADNVAMVYNSQAYPHMLNNNGDLYRWGYYTKFNQYYQPSGPYITPKSKVKVMSGVRRIVDQALWSTVLVTNDIRSNLPFVIKFDDCLYDFTGTVKLADNVNDVCMSYMTTQSDDRGDLVGLILKNDGNLYQVTSSRSQNDISAPILIASGVALSGKPFSSIKTNVVPVDTVAGFQDVHSYNWFAEPVLWAVQNGITDGTASGVFSPGKLCTHAQVLTFMWRANGSPKPTIKNTLKNLPNGQWYTDAVLWAYENKILPREDRFLTMDLNSPCVRGDVAIYLHNEAGNPDANMSNGVYFTDVGTYYNRAVRWAYGEGITDGVGGGLQALEFGTLQTCTRAQIVTFLYRAYANK